MDDRHARRAVVEAGDPRLGVGDVIRSAYSRLPRDEPDDLQRLLGRLR